MLSSPGRGVGKRAALLTQVAALATLVVASTCLTGSHLCPRSLDCAQQGRKFCKPGHSHCGDCLSPLVENSHGKCVVKRRHATHVGKTSTYPELDEEIDFLSAIIAEQRETARGPAPPTQDVPEHKKEEAIAPSSTQLSTTEKPTTQSPPPNSTTPPTSPNLTAAARLSNPKTLPYPANDSIFIIMSGVFIAAACLAFAITGVCWVRLQKGVRLAQKVDYPAYGLMAAHSYDNNVPGDKKLAHSAQMYHYQHQKQQMLSLEKQGDEPKVSDSGATSDEENEDGDFTVYECPGLAPTGEMEVKNPLFDDSTLYLQRFHK